MYKFSYILLLIFFVNFNITFGDEDFEHSLTTSGYVAFNAEYISGLPSFTEFYDEIGFNIAEASLLNSYDICSRIKLFSVITFKPRYDLNSTIAELSAEYTIFDELKIRTGRFILPINPINDQYYAVMNKGISHPSFITNHKLFPINLNGIDFHGTFNLYDNDLHYHIVGGQYEQISQSEEGVLGFFGREGIFMSDDLEAVKKKLNNYDSTSKLSRPNYFGTGTSVSYQTDLFSLGIGGFYTQEDKTISSSTKGTQTLFIDLFSYGTDFSFAYKGLNFYSSFWFGNEIPSDTSLINAKDYYILSTELAYELFQTTTPYFRFEAINGMGNENRIRFISGINYRPAFEITLKLENIYYIQNYIDNFNVFNFSVVYSF
jgi:hypothetical protein